MIDFLLYPLLAIGGIILLYIGIRLVSKAAFRSYFETKTEFKKEKNNGKI